MEADAVKEEAGDYLRSLLNKNLRVTATDSRMFCGEFKCTDPVRLHLRRLYWGGGWGNRWLITSL